MKPLYDTAKLKFSNWFLWEYKKRTYILTAFILNKKAQPLSSPFCILLFFPNLPPTLLPTFELGYSGQLACGVAVRLVDTCFFWISASEVFCSLKTGILWHWHPSWREQDSLLLSDIYGTWIVFFVCFGFVLVLWVLSFFFFFFFCDSCYIVYMRRY